MEWILGSVLIPLIGFIWKIHRDIKEDGRSTEHRFVQVEQRVTINEQKIQTLQKEISEIDKLVSELTEVKINIAKILTILEERSK
jgi:uridine kinase